MTEHADIPSGEVHIIYQWSYANAAARTGASGFVSADIGKVAHQQDNDSFWVLTATTPTWSEITGTGATTSFLGLTDTPSSYSGQAGNLVAVNSTPDALEFVAAVTAFLDLSDTPSSYSGQAGKMVAVNSTPDGLEFVDAPGGFVFAYAFDTSTGTPPSTGTIRFDNATISSVTNVYVHDTDGGSNDLDLVLDEVSIGSLLAVLSAVDGDFAVFKVTSNTDSGAYHTFGVNYLIHSGGFANAEAIYLSVGAGGGGGASGSGTDNNLVRWDGTTNIQDSAIAVADDGSAIQSVSDAGTSDQKQMLKLSRRTSGTPATGFGQRIVLSQDYNGGEDEDALYLEVEWGDASTPWSIFTIWAKVDTGMNVIARFSTDNSAPAVLEGNARGIGSVDLQQARTNAAEVASGNYSFLAPGKYNQATGNYATVLAGEDSVAGALHAMAIGSNAHADSQGVIAHAGNNSFGDPLYRVQTLNANVHDIVTHNDATWRTLYTDGSSGYLAIPQDTQWVFEALVSGVVSGATKGFGFRVVGVLKNDGGTTAMQDTATTTTLSNSDDASFECQAIADNTNDALLIQVRDTDGASDVVMWNASIRISEVRYT